MQMKPAVFNLLVDHTDRERFAALRSLAADIWSALKV